MAAEPESSDAALPVRVEPMLIAELGPEHFAHAVYRRGSEGPRIVAWGDRILQWPLRANALVEEVVPPAKNFPRPRPGQWAAGRYSNGGCAVDVNGDDKDEIVVACRVIGQAGVDVVWLEEPAGKLPWKEHLIGHRDCSSTNAPHDILPLAAKVADKTLRGVVLVSERRQLLWYEMPNDPAKSWQAHPIAELTDQKTGKQPGGRSQSGLAIGDIAGRGRPDVVCGMFWTECLADPSREAWKARRYATWDDKGWGGMTKHGLADLDGDGDTEIVAAEAEIPNARLAVFHRDPQAPDALWQCQMVDTGLYCPHSLVLADVNTDGRLDILVGEMTAGGWSYPLNPQPRILLYVNQGHLKFQRFTLASGRGVHEMGWVPLAEGKLFLYAADEIQIHKFPDMKTHVIGWTISPK